MADSIQEQIVKKIVVACASITVANGYANTIASVQRHNQSGIDLATLPTILVKEGECSYDLMKSASPRIRRRMELFLVVATQQDETPDSTDTRSGGEMLNSLVADIEQRLGASQNWDGLALMTDPPSYLEIDIDAVTPHMGRGLRVEVSYEHVRNNPYSQ